MLGAGLGSAIGGWLSDKVGRKKALLLGDVLFTLGALLMAAAHSPNALITGQSCHHIAKNLNMPTLGCLERQDLPCTYLAHINWKA